MERICINSPVFTRIYDQLVAENKLSNLDFIEFEQELLKDLKKGSVIPGMEGLRKARIKPATRGKRGGLE